MVTSFCFNFPSMASLLFQGLADFWHTLFGISCVIFKRSSGQRLIPLKGQLLLAQDIAPCTNNDGKFLDQKSHLNPPEKRLSTNWKLAK